MERARETQARRAARRVGLVARKSRRNRDSIENRGEFMLVDPATNIPQAGFQYDMTPEEVIGFCVDTDA